MKNIIEQGNAYLGIEFGSTRIKAVITDSDGLVLASGGVNWENQLQDGVWVYTVEQIHKGMQDCYTDLRSNVKENYGVELKKVKAIGISGMMHGYIALDSTKNVIAPFRTWRNNITAEESSYLTDLFQFHIPQRWSIAHLCQMVRTKEEHLKNLDYLTTLAGYIHYLLTDKKVLGICEASGMFPIDPSTMSYNKRMIEKFNCLLKENNLTYSVEDILPSVLSAGQSAGFLTEEGAKLLDISGNLEAGIPLCPPEGDAGTGMIATNSIKQKTGNISAGTSAFATIVLEKELSSPYDEFDILQTPDGSVAAMVHSNNCTTEINSWVSLFEEVLQTFGKDVSSSELYETLFHKAMEGENDCGGLMAYGFHSGEHLLELSHGCPMFLHTPDSNFNLANFMKAQIYTSFGVVKFGLDRLKENEGVTLDQITGHGGIFKTQGVAQNILASAINTPVAVNASAGEGGAWGIAVLAMYLDHADKLSLPEFLNNVIFRNSDVTLVTPDPEISAGYEKFMESYLNYLPTQRTAVQAGNS